jgi:hypothetical protein
MLVYLTALTWTHDPEPFAAEIREAQRQGLHLQLCHEFPSVIDLGSSRYALEFKAVMDATPADLKKWPTNIYSQIAIALKGGELRKPGLSVLAHCPMGLRRPRGLQVVAQESQASSSSCIENVVTGTYRTPSVMQRWRALLPFSLRGDPRVGAPH